MYAPRYKKTTDLTHFAEQRRWGERIPRAFYILQSIYSDINSLKPQRKA